MGGVLLAARNHRRWIEVLAVLLLAALGFFALRHMLAEITYRDLRTAVRSIPTSSLLACMALTAISYLALTFYDFNALRVIGKHLPWRKAAIASFTSYTLSHSLGLAILTGGSARYRVYRQEGLEPGDVGSVIAIASITFWSSVLLMAGLGLLLGSGLSFPLIGDSPVLRHILGALFVCIGFVPFILRPAGVPALHVGSWSMPLPRPRQAVALTAAGVVDLVASSTALFVLVPDLAASLWPVLFAAYSVAMIVALISHIPGGMGVFEAVILAALPADRTGLLAALLVYRVIYYLAPLAIAALLLLWRERHPVTQGLAAGLQRSGMAGRESLLPPILAVLTFFGGALLLLSGATPALHGRANILATWVPLPFVEVSHVAASLTGLALLFLADGLWRKLDGAAKLARGVLIAGGLFSLIRGLEWEGALICFGVAGLIQIARPAFYRRTAIQSEPPSAAALIAIAIVLAGVFATGLYAYAHVPYSHDLWLRFVVHDGAPRFLRACLAIALSISAYTAWRIMRPAPTEAPGEPFDAARINAAMDVSDSCDSYLALTGDKRFLYAEQGDAYLMFGTQGSTWIVMGDPVGPEARWGALLWRLRELSDEAQASLVLYEITERCLPHAIDMGLKITKYGEEALVDLAEFNLAGSAFKSIRHAVRRAETDGATFEVLPRETIDSVMPELRDVSDEWLETKHQREKGFSLGRFDPDYLRQFDIALVRQQGRIVAFANILALPNHRELSVDLMRHRAELPYGSMDFLFSSLMLWGREQGYDRFSLGIAPLAGMPNHRLAPMFGRMGDRVFRHGSRFYGFTGLRAFKAKFVTRWAPRYLAAPSSLGLIRSIVSLHSLISKPDQHETDDATVLAQI